MQLETASLAVVHRTNFQFKSCLTLPKNFLINFALVRFYNLFSENIITYNGIASLFSHFFYYIGDCIQK